MKELPIFTIGETLRAGTPGSWSGEDEGDAHVTWSTRQLADLAGTTVNTVRHYHRLGLLEEPDRRVNGYEQYGVRHLVKLLRLRRLVELGVPSARIGEVGAGGQDGSRALREVDAELLRQIGRLQRARTDIAAILRQDAPADVPAGFEEVGARMSARMSEADTSMIHLYTQLYDEEALADVLPWRRTTIGP